MVDDVGVCFEKVWVEEVEEMNYCVFVVEVDYVESDVFNDGGGGLMMDLIMVDECVFEEGCNGVDIVFSYFIDVFEEEGQRFEYIVLDVEFWYVVFVYQSREDGEGCVSFCNDIDSDGGVDMRLMFLYVEVVKECGENVLRIDCFGDEIESIVGSLMNVFFVCFEYVEEFEVDMYLFLCVYVFRFMICDMINQVDCVFLYFFVLVVENRSEMGEEIFNRRLYLCDIYDCDNGMQSIKDGIKYFRVFFIKVFVENNIEFVYECIFVILFYYECNL